MRTFIVGALALTFAAGSTGVAQSNSTVDRAVDAWSKVKSLSGSFEQTLQNPLTRRTSTAAGSFKQQRPNKLAIRFTDPAGDAIVADGQFLWVNLQQATPGQVIKRPLTDDMAAPVDLGQFLDAPATKFDIVAGGAETVGGRSTHKFDLTPKRRSTAAFNKATVWIDDADGLIRQFEVSETSGVVRRVRLTKLDVNAAVSASDFKFTVPKGLRVIER
jgi:outer membrane lipoprotein-sorting protein